MQFKQEMYHIQNTFAEIDFNSRDRAQILAHREEFVRLASPYIANSQIGLLVSFVASFIGKQMLLENADELPELIQAKVLHPKTVLSVANSEANGGTDLREMRSFSEDGTLKIHTKYATNLGQADFVICSYYKGESVNLALVQLTPSMQSDLSNELQGLSGGVTGSFKAEQLTTMEYFELSNSRAKLQYCYNMERYLISLVCLCVMREAYQTALDYSTSIKRSGETLIEHQFIQDKVFKLKRNIFQIEAMMDAIIPNSGYDYQSELSILKIAAVDAAFESVELAIEICGKHSLTDKWAYLNVLSDLTCLRFLGGTRELHKMTVIENEKRTLRVTKNKSASASA
jgi:alkylation response protein AidB-like acyl-CoA dehydrogenase